MSNEDLNLRMKLTGNREAAAGVKKVGDGVEKLGRQSKRTGHEQEQAARKSRLFGRSLSGSSGATAGAIGRMKKLALAVGGTALAYASVHGIEKSIDRTVELTGASVALTRVFGLSQKAASEYAIVADTLGVDQKSFATGMTFLSRNVVAAVGQQGKLAGQQGKSRKKVAELRAEIVKLGHTEKDRAKKLKLQGQIEAELGKRSSLASGKQLAAFKALGISQATLKSGDMNKVFEETIDKLNKMPGGPQKAALQMQIFGRGAAKLAPLIAQGADGLEEWRRKSADAAKQLSPELLKKYKEEQRESKLMWTELSVVIGTKMLPKIMRLEHAMLDAMKAWKDGTGVMGEFRGVVEGVSGAMGKVFDFFTKNPKLLKGVAVGIIAVASAIKIFGIATALLEAPLTIAVAEMLGLDAAMTANPIGLIVVALAALAVVLVVAYKKVGWFHDAVDAVFGFIKKHWMLVGTMLLGPIFPAIVAIVRHWKSIHKAISGTIDFVKQHWKAMVIGLSGPFAPVVAVIITNFGRIKSAFSNVIDFIKGAWNTLAGVLNSGIDVANKVPGAQDIGQIPTFGGGGGGASIASARSATTAFENQQLGAVPVRKHRSKLKSGTLSGKLAAAMPAHNGGGGGTETVNLHVDGKHLASAMVKHGKWVSARA